jgi:hypothetical protein
MAALDTDVHPIADARLSVSDGLKSDERSEAGGCASRDAYSTPMSRSKALAAELKVVIRKAAKPTALEELVHAIPTFSTFHQVVQAGNLADDERVDFILHTLIPDLSARLERGRQPMAIRELLKWRDDDGDPQSLTTRYHKAAAQLQVSGANFEKRWEPKLLIECAGAFCRFDVDDRRLRATPAGADGSAPLSPTDPCVGLISLYRRLDERKFADAMPRAQTITILNTYIPELSVYERALRQALVNGAEVAILLLHFDSSAAALRSASMVEGVDALYEESRIRIGVRHNLAILGALARALDGDARPRLRVALYDSLPSLAIYRIDDRALASVFLHGQLAVDAPQMEISGRGTLLGDMVFGELETLWDIAHEIADLCTWTDNDRSDSA